MPSKTYSPELTGEEVEAILWMIAGMNMPLNTLSEDQQEELTALGGTEFLKAGIKGYRKFLETYHQVMLDRKS